MSQYQQETAVEPVADGLFKGHICGDWNIDTNPNGGYLVSVVMSALSQSLPHPDPLSVTTHYLRPGIPGEPCEVSVEVVRTGRTLSTARATLRQQGKERIEVLTAFGDLSQAVGVPHQLSMTAPEIPPPEACVERNGDIQGIALPITERLDVFLHPDQAVPGKAQKAEINGWIRLKDGTPPDTRSLLLFVDAFPPSVFPLLGVVGWVPTVELTVHVRKRPAPGWIQGRFRTDDLEGGRMIETAALWDSEGSLVAQARQIGLVMQSS